MSNMNFDTVGEIHRIAETKQVNPNLKRREFILKVMVKHENKYIPEYLRLSCKDGLCEMLDGFRVKDKLRAYCRVRGYKFDDQASTRYVTIIEAWKITK